MAVIRPHKVTGTTGVLSYYEMHVAGTNVVVLGLGGRFIPLQEVEEATLKIGRMAF